MLRQAVCSFTSSRFGHCLILATLGLPSFARGDSFEWTNAVSGNYSTAGNWTLLSGPGPAPPGIGDEARFNEVGTYTVTFINNENSDLLTFSTGTVTFRSSGTDNLYRLNSGTADAVLSGGTLTLGVNNDPLELFVGDDLVVNSGAQLSVKFGSDVTTTDLTLGTSITAGVTSTITVDGSGSTLDRTGTSATTWGLNGSTANLTLSNGAVGNLNGTLTLVSSSNSQSAANLSVLSDSDLELDSLVLGSGNAISATGTMTVSGNGSTITQTGTSTLLLGTATGNVGVLSIASSGTFTTGTGAITLNDTGTINIQGGTLNANGLLTITVGSELTIDGGALNAAAGLNNSAGGALSFRDGSLTVSGGTFSPTASGVGFSVSGSAAGKIPHLTITNGATGSVNALFRVGDLQQGKLTLNNGGQLSSDMGQIGALAAGEVTVTGANSRWTNTGSFHVGLFSTGTLLIEAGGEVTNTFGRIGGNGGNPVSPPTTANGNVTVTGENSRWTNSSFLTVGDNGVGYLSVLAGGDVTCSYLQISRLPGVTGTVLVSGAGSTLTTGYTDVGGDSVIPGGAAALSLFDHGSFVGTVFRVASTGTVTIDSGTLSVSAFDNTKGGVFNFIGGTLSVASGIGVGSSNPFPGSFSIGFDHQLITPAVTTIAASRTLALNGGLLRTGSLAVNGVFAFNSGTLELTGGSITGVAQLNVPTNGTLLASGTYGVRVAGAAGSQIAATGNVTLGNSLSPTGFGTAGSLDVRNHSVTLQDANDVVFDSLALVTLGSGANPGTLAAANGLTLDFGGNITGYGTINTPNSAAKLLINNGHITGNSGAQPITLSGYVKGVGTLDNVVITGTDSPGFSPATVVRGSVIYDGILQIEIEGSGASEFDRIDHLIGAGVADLGGALEVFADPNVDVEVGDLLLFLHASGGIFNSFDSVSLPALGGGKSFRLLYGETIVGLEVVLTGDYNSDGTVNAADYTVWRDTLGSTTNLAANGNGDSSIDIGDYGVWKATFGNTSGSGGEANVNTAAPEPATVSLLMLAAVVWWFRRYQAA